MCKRFSGVTNQFLVAILGNFATLSYSIGAAWLSPNIPVLQSDKTPLSNGPLTDDQTSWVGSILSIGGLSGCIIYGWIGDRYGRKISCVFIGFPHLVSWLLIAYGTNYYTLLLGRFLCGFGGGGTYTVFPMYVSEIAQDNVRGRLGSFITMAYYVGILLGFIGGSYFSYEFTPIVTLFFPTIYLIAMAIFPETPQYLSMHNKVDLAKLSLSIFRSKCSSNNFQTELQKLLKIKEIGISDENKINLADFTTRSAIKALIISFWLISMTQFNGVFVILNYASSLFSESGSSLSIEDSTIVIAVIQLLGSITSSFFVDRLGRKCLYYISSIGCGLSLFFLGIYFNLKFNGYDLTAIQWGPIVGFSGVLLFASWGLSTLPYVVMSEICSQKIRGIITTLAIFWSWILSFLLVKYFLDLSDLFGLHGCMWIFSFSCFATLIFVARVLPETKGRSVDDIIILLEK